MTRSRGSGRPPAQEFLPFQRRLAMSVAEVESFYRLPDHDEICVVWPRQCAQRGDFDYLFVRRADDSHPRDMWWVKLRPPRGGKGARWPTGVAFDPAERDSPRRPQLAMASQKYIAFLAEERLDRLGVASPETLLISDVLRRFVVRTVDRHEVLRRITKGTVLRVMETAKRIAPVFDGARVGGLSERTPVDFMKVATQPKAEGGLGLKHNTAAGDLAILRRALETTLTTPASAFRAPFEIPRAEKVLHGIFSPAEIARIALAAFEGRVWDASAGDWARAPDGSPALCDRKTARAREPLGRIFRLGLMFGSRPCVHLRVTWVDLGGPWIDLDRRILHRLGRAEEETAKRKGRCRIPKADLPTLRAWRDGDLARGIVHVVHRPDGAPLARVDYRVWRRMMAASGARPLGPHSCKHTLVQAMKRARVALSAVAEYVFTREKTLQEHYGADWDEALTAQAARALSDPAFYSRGWPQDGEVVGAGGLAATWADAETDDAAAEALEELDEADSEEDAAAA